MYAWKQLHYESEPEIPAIQALKVSVCQTMFVSASARTARRGRPGVATLELVALPRPPRHHHKRAARLELLAVCEVLAQDGRALPNRSLLERLLAELLAVLEPLERAERIGQRLTASQDIHFCATG